MPDVNWNKAEWGASYSWHDGGEEWSTHWNGSEAQWFGSIFPRVHRFLPAGRILEIAPGFGRWTKFLIPACDEYLGIDLNEKCIHACRERFATVKHARFLTNDGLSLAAAEDSSFDFIFSFDSLVHAEADVLRSYIPQVIQKLSPTGVAFLHHSNGLDCDINPPPHGRGQTVSAGVVADLIRQNDGMVLIQEVVDWGCNHLIDCFSLLARRDAYPVPNGLKITNPAFMLEGQLIKNMQSPYSNLFGTHHKRDIDR